MTKELLSEVLDKEVVDFKKYGQDDNILDISFIDDWRFINIYELAHKCKRWVIKNSGWTLQSYTNERGVGICRVKVGDGQKINKLIGTSEVDSIFKATEWVYAEIKKRGKLK